MRASRLVSVLLLLQAKGSMTAHQLAAELGVSVRTVYRDVESLSAAGVPVYGAAGHDGGYRLVDGYRTRLTGLTSDEAEAIFLTGLPGPAADLGLGTVLATAQLKLMAALPDESRQHATRIRQRFHLDPAGWYAATDVPPRLATVADAVWRRRRIRMRYRRWEAPQEVTRTVQPYGIVLKGGLWYLVAARSGSIRTYRISQIARATVLDEGFDLPDGFDLATHWQAYLDDFDRRRYHGEATIRLTAQVFDRLPDLLEPAVVRAARASAGPVDPVGRIVVRIPTESAVHSIRTLLPLGAEAEVLAPAELRGRFTDAIDALAGLYRTPGPADVG